MLVGWAINSAMIILAAATFYLHHDKVDELQQAQTMLGPLLGNHAGVVFAIALFFAGIASSITSGMAGGSIFAGLFSEPYDVKDNHSRLGIALSLITALLLIFIIGSPFKALIISQMILSVQLPFTIFLQIYLTSSKEVMGKYVNTKSTTVLMLLIGLIVTFLNVLLFMSFL